MGSVPSSSIFSCISRLPPLFQLGCHYGFCTILLNLLLYQASLSSLVQLGCHYGFCTILLHLFLYWASPSSKPHLFVSPLMLYIHLILGLHFAQIPLTSIFTVSSIHPQNMSIPLQQRSLPRFLCDVSTPKPGTSPDLFRSSPFPCLALGPPQHSHACRFQKPRPA